MRGDAPGSPHVPTRRLDFTVGRMAVFQPGSTAGPVPVIQPQLAVGSPADPHEAEAERIADAVTGAPGPADEAGPEADTEADRAATASTASLLEQLELSDAPVVVHRACAACTADEEDDRPALRREAVAGAGVPRDASAIVADGVRAGGAPLPRAVRAAMEPRFGVDFGAVRIHTGAAAAASALALGANAYTVGRDIVFGVGRWAPSTQAGRRLLAHELAHVVQQSRGRRATASREMIPGFLARHAVVGPVRTQEAPVVQREKIEHRALEWADFQGKVPKKSPYWASTASGFNPPGLKAVIPTALAAVAGGECVAATKKSGDVMGTTFTVDIGIDSSAIDVTAYMDQGASWRRPWLTDDTAREAKCRKEFVGPCKTYLSKQEAALAKDCTKREAACVQALKGGSAEFTLTVGTETFTATTEDECASEILAGCQRASASGLSYESTMAGTTITATASAECETGFLTACTGELLDAAAARLLEHEQGHFDITNLRAEQTRDALRTLADGFDREVSLCATAATPKAEKAAKAKVVATAKAVLAKELKALEKAYAAGRKALSTTQKTYDSETQHGVVEAMQQQWQEQIAEGLP